jgi:ATP-dependent Clp endopeptidase proteolytic subunit ClpP
MTIRNNGVEEEEEDEGGTFSMGEDEEDVALFGLVGDINEQALKEMVACLLSSNKHKIIHENKDEFKNAKDVELFICSAGGSVSGMFAIYDLMRLVKANRDIATYGYGQIASAAVLILASGTPGKRYIAKNARVMLHHCSSSTMGSTPDVRSSYEELKKVEEMMVAAIAENSNLGLAEIYNIFSRNTDEHFSAEEIIEMGLADKII